VSASLYGSQLRQKRRQRIDAEKQAGECRSKESRKRADADAARASAAKSKVASIVKSKLRTAQQRDKEAAAAGREASRWQVRAAGHARDEAVLVDKLTRAQTAEVDAAEQRRAREQQQAARDALAQRTALQDRLDQAEQVLAQVLREVRPPRREILRVLLLGAASEGDLRVGREQKRIRAAVESALHRDLIELDVRPAATSADLLDGLTKFRPHVVHFSGHSSESLILFEDEVDEPHEGVTVTARAFAAALRATDDPPLLVLLNSCRSAGQIDALVQEAVLFAIGMADEIDDGDAINYAAQFYASLANGQSIHAAHLTGRAALQLAGLDGADLPTLASATGANPATALLVSPDPETR
jgi:hypothetical protein